MKLQVPIAKPICNYFDPRFGICNRNGMFHYYQQPCPYNNRDPRFGDQPNCTGYEPMKTKNGGE